MKYTIVQTTHSLQSDLHRLLSIIRERESSLVILLEEKHEKEWERPSWLLKQCEYQEKESRLSRQIRSIILKWVLINSEEQESESVSKQIRTFWVKAKMVMKMSLQRMKLLSLLSYSLFEQYQAIIEGMNQGYDRCGGIAHYRDIQQMIKNRNRNIHDLLTCGIQLQSNRERYQLKVKQSVKQFPSDSKINHRPLHSIKANKDILTIDSKALRRPRSHQSNKNQNMYKQFLLSKKIKKIEKFMSSYEQKIGDVMNAKLQINLDSKKSLQCNIQHLIDNIMQKNIHNHKIISKFIFSNSGRAFKRIASKKQIRTTKRIIQVQSIKPLRKQIKKKAKLSLPYRRAASAKLKRKEFKQMLKLGQSQIVEGKVKGKKLVIR